MRYLYTGSQIKIIKELPVHCAHTETMKHAYKSILSQYGSISDTTHYYHSGRGEWKKHTGTTEGHKRFRTEDLKAKVMGLKPRTKKAQPKSSGKAVRKHDERVVYFNWKHGRKTFNPTGIMRDWVKVTDKSYPVYKEGKYIGYYFAGKFNPKPESDIKPRLTENKLKQSKPIPRTTNKLKVKGGTVTKQIKPVVKDITKLKKGDDVVFKTPGSFGGTVTQGKVISIGTKNVKISTIYSAGAGGARYPMELTMNKEYYAGHVSNGEKTKVQEPVKQKKVRKTPVESHRDKLQEINVKLETLRKSIAANEARGSRPITDIQTYNRLAKQRDKLLGIAPVSVDKKTGQYVSEAEQRAIKDAHTDWNEQAKAHMRSGKPFRDKSLKETIERYKGYYA